MSISVRSRQFGSMVRLIFSVLTVTVFSAVLLVGCGKDDDPPDGTSTDDDKPITDTTGTGGGDSTNNSVDRNIVCADGEAWVADESVNDAFILRSNGVFLAIVKDDAWYFDERLGSATYSTSRNTLTIHFDGGNETETVTYSVSGNKLTLTFDGDDGEYSQTYTKKSGINPVYRS